MAALFRVGEDRGELVALVDVAVVGGLEVVAEEGEGQGVVAEVAGGLLLTAVDR